MFQSLPARGSHISSPLLRVPIPQHTITYDPMTSTETLKQSPVEEQSIKLQRLQKEESRLWRTALLFVTILAAGVGATSWQSLAGIPRHLEAIPLGTVVVVLLFAVYVALKRKEIAELQGVLRGMQEREKTPPSEQQLNKLLEAVSNSQRNYRELIDSTAVVAMTTLVLAAYTSGFDFLISRVVGWLVRF